MPKERQSRLFIPVSNYNKTFTGKVVMVAIDIYGKSSYRGGYTEELYKRYTTVIYMRLLQRLQRSFWRQLLTDSSRCLL